MPNGSARRAHRVRKYRSRKDRRWIRHRSLQIERLPLNSDGSSVQTSSSPEISLHDAVVHPLPPAAASPAESALQTAFPILAMLSVCHLLNDMIQSLLPAIYPLLKDSFRLDFGQIGLITLTFQITASLLQPLVGIYTDKKPMPYSLAIGMGFTLGGLLLLSQAPTFPLLLSRRGADRLRIVGLPSGVVARRTHGFGRPARACAIAVPGRRQRRLGDRTAARRLHRDAARPGQRRLVLRSPRSSPSFS